MGDSVSLSQIKQSAAFRELSPTQQNQVEQLYDELKAFDGNPESASKVDLTQWLQENADPSAAQRRAATFLKGGLESGRFATAIAPGQNQCSTAGNGPPYRFADVAISEWTSGHKQAGMKMMRTLNEQSGAPPVSYLVSKIAELGDKDLIPMLRAIAEKHTDCAGEEAQQAIAKLQ